MYFRGENTSLNLASQGCWLGLQSSEFWLFRSVSGSFQGSFGARPLLAEIFFGHLAGFVDLVPYCRLLMRPLQLHLLRDFTPLIDSQDLLVPLSSEFKVLCVAWVLSFSPSRREAFCCSSPFIGHYHGRVRSGVGGQFFTLTGVSGVWSKEEVFDHINTLELKAVLLALQNLESLVVGHLLLMSFRLHDGGFVHHFSGWNSFLIPVSAGLGPVGMVSSEENFSSRGSHSREEYFVDFLSRGWYLPTVWVLNRAVFRPIYRMLFFPFGVSFVRVSFQFPAPKVLLSVPGCFWRGK